LAPYNPLTLAQWDNGNIMALPAARSYMMIWIPACAGMANAESVQQSENYWGRHRIGFNIEKCRAKIGLVEGGM
jgi:hypothetical protein